MKGRFYHLITSGSTNVRDFFPLMSLQHVSTGLLPVHVLVLTAIGSARTAVRFMLQQLSLPSGAQQVAASMAVSSEECLLGIDIVCQPSLANDLRTAFKEIDVVAGQDDQIVLKF